jgi:hypothetical protein
LPELAVTSIKEHRDLRKSFWLEEIAVGIELVISG